MQPHELTITEAARLIKSRKLSPIELVESCLQRIEAVEPRVQAWARGDRVGALAAAREMEGEAAAGRLRGPLHGIPLG
ncbi:MAG: Asp-tRNA(Asn)/Glu-tRNA(Gln) amidotransferase GatCAB subunit A, partial [Chloroflexi bacterium]|nr:Asp-tRNA(Asn)/Glu-tRNA(Gln) amidotransferase GatCAB subunit A [Chloroflexota bacterium]